MLAEISEIDKVDNLVKSDFEAYYTLAQKQYSKIPNVLGMAGMDAVSLLENLGLKVKLVGNGTVSKQSIGAGKTLNKGEKIILNLS